MPRTQTTKPRLAYARQPPSNNRLYTSQRPPRVTDNTPIVTHSNLKRSDPNPQASTLHHQPYDGPPRTPQHQPRNPPKPQPGPRLSRRPVPPKLRSEGGSRRRRRAIQYDLPTPKPAEPGHPTKSDQIRPLNPTQITLPVTALVTGPGAITVRPERRVRGCNDAGSNFSLQPSALLSRPPASRQPVRPLQPKASRARASN
jgi:hypothetical protein